MTWGDWEMHVIREYSGTDLALTKTANEAYLWRWEHHEGGRPMQWLMFEPGVAKDLIKKICVKYKGHALESPTEGGEDLRIYIRNEEMGEWIFLFDNRTRVDQDLEAEIVWRCSDYVNAEGRVGMAAVGGPVRAGVTLSSVFTDFISLTFEYEEE